MFYSFAQSLVCKLPPSLNTFTELIFASYYDNNAVSKDLNFEKDILLKNTSYFGKFTPI